MAIAINADTLERGRDDFMSGYVEAMLWVNTFIERPGKEDCETDDVRYWYQGPGRWWEDTPVDLTDAEAFWEAFGYVLLSLDYGEYGCEYWGRAVLAGHDFALTRNDHGTGFWDRGLGAIGNMLSNECKPYGSHNVTLEVDENDDVISAHNGN